MVCEYSSGFFLKKRENWTAFIFLKQNSPGAMLGDMQMTMQSFNCCCVSVYVWDISKKLNYY